MSNHRYVPTPAEAAETRAIHRRLLRRMAVVMLGYGILILVVTAVLTWGW